HSQAPAAPAGASRLPIASDEEFHAAMTESARMKDPEKRDAARLNALLAWAERDTRSAFLHAASLPLTLSNEYQRDLLFQRWLKKEPRAAGEYATFHSTGRMRDSLLGLLALHLADDDPLQAIGIISREMNQGPIR